MHDPFLVSRHHWLRLASLLAVLTLFGCDHRQPTSALTSPIPGLDLDPAPLFGSPRLGLEPGMHQQFGIEWAIVAVGVDTTARNFESTIESESVVGNLLATRGRYVLVETRDAWPRLIARHLLRQDDRGWYELIEPSIATPTTPFSPTWRAVIERYPRLTSLTPVSLQAQGLTPERPEPYELTLLRFPLSPGARWEVTPGQTDLREAIGVETIETPAGRFSAWHIRFTPRPVPGSLYQNYREDYWYGRLGLIQATVHAEWTLPETFFQKELHATLEMRRVLEQTTSAGTTAGRD